LIVEFSDGAVQRFCVSFTEQTISGLDLLVRSGLPVHYQDYGGGSVAMCKIGPDGCDYPSKPCFCKCPNPSKGCRFWGYYTLDRSTGSWEFATEGAGTREVHDGDIDGWRWGTHESANPPPASSLSSICTSGTVIGPSPKPAASPRTVTTSGGTAPPKASGSSPFPKTTAASRSPTPTPSASSANDPRGSQAAAATPTDGNRRSPGAAAVALVLASAAGLGVWGARRLRGTKRAQQ
jgi:hypothetical protein